MIFQPTHNFNNFKTNTVHLRPHLITPPTAVCSQHIQNLSKNPSSGSNHQLCLCLIGKFFCKPNTNKLIGKFNLGRLIISAAQRGPEMLQMTKRLMIELTQKNTLTILNRHSWDPLRTCLLEIFENPACYKICCVQPLSHLFMLRAVEVQQVQKFSWRELDLSGMGELSVKTIPKHTVYSHSGFCLVAKNMTLTDEMLWYKQKRAYPPLY